MTVDYLWMPPPDVLGFPESVLRVYLPIGRFEDGWSFMFRGHQIERGLRTFADENDLTIWLAHEGELRLLSWADWKGALGRGGSILGASMEETTFARFCDLVETRAAPGAREASSGLILRSRYDEMIAMAGDESARKHISNTCWKDDAGYSFFSWWYSHRDRVEANWGLGERSQRH